MMINIFLVSKDEKKIMNVIYIYTHIHTFFNSFMLLIVVGRCFLHQVRYKYFFKVFIDIHLLALLV